MDTILQNMRNIKSFLFHPTKHLFSFKKKILIKFSKFRHFEGITNIYWFLLIVALCIVIYVEFTHQQMHFY
jgi:hypothetical protein